MGLDIGAISSGNSSVLFSTRILLHGSCPQVTVYLLDQRAFSAKMSFAYRVSGRFIERHCESIHFVEAAFLIA